MQTKGINLSEKRNFSDELTVTFQFIKQEFKSLMTALAVIVLPLVFVELFMQSFLLKGILAGNVFASDMGWMTLLVNYVLSISAFLWLQLFMLSYLRLYSEKYPTQERVNISWHEVLKLMRRYLGRFLVLDIVYFFMSFVGFVCLLVPGIYLSVLFLFAPYFLVVQDKNLSASFSAFSASSDLCRGQWWGTFGYVILCSLVFSTLGYVFSFPYIGVYVGSFFTGEVPGLFEMTLAGAIAKLGNYLVSGGLVLAIGIRFFSRREGKEHSVLLNKIEQIGMEEQAESGEDKL
ncbi:MAG: hypothetical protein K2I90_12295 [Odoribacter sp.]|nr:hypothetical protein [Odoribacter sp.]